MNQCSVVLPRKGRKAAFDARDLANGSGSGFAKLFAILRAIFAASRRAVRITRTRDASHSSRLYTQSISASPPPHIYNSCRGALCAARHRSAKPLKPRAAFQLLRTTPVAASATVSGSIAAPAVTLRGRAHDMAERKKNAAPR